MKGKMIYPQGKCKSVIPETVLSQMKNALKVIEYPDAIIGPKTVGELIELNTDKTGYSHCIFDELLKEKITTDHNTIKDGLELLKFYKKRNKYLTVFDRDIEDLDKLRLDQNKTKSFTSEIKIIFERNVLKDKEFNTLKNRKDWYVYFNGETLSEKGDTLNKAIEWAKVNMFYKQYRTVEIKYQK